MKRRKKEDSARPGSQYFRKDEIVSGIGTKTPPKFLEQVHSFKVLDVAAREGMPYEVEVAGIALGDVAWVSLPGDFRGAGFGN